MKCYRSEVTLINVIMWQKAVLVHGIVYIRMECWLLKKKTMQVVNELTNYKLYMVDDADKELLFVFPGIFQCKYYENYKVMENRNLDGGMESNAMQTRNSLPMNLRQEMLEKFDSDFPGRVS